MNTIDSTTKDIELSGYTYLLHAGEYYRGCRRCGGTGHYSFNGFDSICYECGNSSARYGVCVGTLEQATKDAEKRLKARLAREAKREKLRLIEVAKTDAKVAALRETHPAVVELLENINLGDEWGEGREKNSFLIAMHEALFFVSNANRPFTEKMIAAVEKNIANSTAKAEADALKAPVVEGRRVVTGKVISTKVVEGDYGTSYKMLVEEEGGARVYGSIASGLWDEVEFLGSYRKHAWNETDGVMTKLVGMEVTFTATVEVSKNDKSFGFFKRPAKAAIVA